MHRAKTLFILAIIVMVVPHLGITNLTEQVTFFIIGLVMLIFAYGIYFEYRGKNKEKISPPRKKTPTQTHIVKTENLVRPHKQFSEEMTGFRLIRRREDIVDSEDNLKI